MSYSATKLYVVATDLGALLEPRRGATKRADIGILEGTTDISNHFLDLSKINANWQAACAAATTNWLSGGSGLSTLFAKLGWVPGATVKYTYTSGSGTMAAFTVDYQPDGTTGGASYNVNRIAAFLCGGGGNGATITSTSGGGGGAGATSTFQILDWPNNSGLLTLSYSVGGATVDTTLTYSYSGTKGVTAKAGSNGSSTTGGSTNASTSTWAQAGIGCTVPYSKDYAGGAGGNGGTTPANGGNGATVETITLVTGLTAITVYSKNGGTKGNNGTGYQSVTIYGGGGGGGAVNLTSSGGAGGNGGNAPGVGNASTGIGCGGGGGSGSWVDPGVSNSESGGSGSGGVISVSY
jgi:hypothetical protein